MKKAKYITANRRQRGFTIIELMITITLVAVLASIAAPSMRVYVLNNRLSSAAQEYLRTLQTARSEATKRQRNVVVCPSANPSDAVPTCTNATALGWILFEDTDGNGDNSNAAELVETHTINSTKMKLLADGAVTYLATGFAAPGGGSAVVMCDSRGNVDSSGGNTGQSVARGIYIAPTGRARVTRTVTSSTDAHDLGELIAATGSTC